MAEDRMMTTAAEIAARAVGSEHGDLLRDAVALVVGELMEAEVAQLTGAGRGQRDEGRVTNLNGYRQRAWETRVGRVDLAIPKTRSGPSFFRRFWSAAALRAGDRHRRDGGLRQRRLYAEGRPGLVEQLGIEGMSKGRVSRMCSGLDEHVEEFRSRPLEGSYPTVGSMPST